MGLSGPEWIYDLDSEWIRLDSSESSLSELNSELVKEQHTWPGNLEVASIAASLYRPLDVEWGILELRIGTKLEES